MQTTIRLARPDDFTAWLPLWQGYQTFYKTQIPASVTELTWARFHQPGDMHCAVAEADGGLVGLVHYIAHRSCWTAGDYWYLQDLFVLPQQRGTGVGRALIQHVYASALAQGAARVWWLTHESNTDACICMTKWPTKAVLCNTVSSCRSPEDCLALNVFDGCALPTVLVLKGFAWCSRLERDDFR